MIRFVDMREADIFGFRFAFWDTAVDSFVTIGGSQAWDTWDELLQASKVTGETGLGLERMRRLCPPWVDAGDLDIGDPRA